MTDKIEQVARVLEPQAWAALGCGDTLAYKSRRTSSLRKARAAIEKIRKLTQDQQIAGMEAMLRLIQELDGPVKSREECKTPEDWMERGFALGKRMLSSREIVACHEAMVDTALGKEG